ncbi:hypothetical protein I532_04210 [Brevibacillus borstelensis AK1]|uniref:Uncharacterized protein n=1 Tax=Brevibacillus borstelensis AK1 TaxID=1300222 RepID=M8EH35_9BACL|nr:hypothetical protein [Brevibacillus borstelensis]EMT54780.1 hypothetical protein I532_04210 [Brevibacillus borstelensis AK1]
MPTYPRNEQETVLTFDRETNEWTAYSCVPAHVRRIIAIAPDYSVLDHPESGEPLAVRATLTAKQVRIVTKPKPRELTDEQRAEIAARLRSKRPSE